MEFDTASHLKKLLGLELPPLPGSSKTACAKAGEDFSFGIEEEYFLADAETMLIAEDPAPRLFEAAAEQLGSRVGREFLQPQIEVATKPHHDTADAREELVRLRHGVGEIAAEHGIAIMAAGTHPTARWRHVEQTPKKRYGAVMDGLQMIGQRNMLCGMHVHVQLPDPDRRVDVMSRMIPYIPLFVALSTSSPFWQSRRTGLLGYRLAAYDELPRTGLPDLFKTTEEYDAYINALVKSGAVQDSSFVWWTIRPSLKYPTLELRAPDCCTRVEDALAIAALYRALIRHLYFDHQHNGAMDVVARAISVENKWRAQRFGVAGTFVAKDGAISVADMLDQVIERVQDDAAALGCTAEVAACQRIIVQGTSADQQLRIFDQGVSERGTDAALQDVCRWIASTTVQS